MKEKVWVGNIGKLLPLIRAKREQCLRDGLGKREKHGLWKEQKTKLMRSWFAIAMQYQLHVSIKLREQKLV